LQQHALAQAIDEHRGDQSAIGFAPGFFFDDRGHDQRFVRCFVGQIPAPARPKPHPACVAWPEGARQQFEIARLLVEKIGIGKQLAFKACRLLTPGDR
jgi:hypothetical protein